MSVQLNKYILNSSSTGELCELIEEHAEEFDHNGCHPERVTPGAMAAGAAADDDDAARTRWLVSSMAAGQHQQSAAERGDEQLRVLEK